MKKLIIITFLFACLVSFGQTKYLVVNGVITQTGIPDVFKRPNGQTIWGGYGSLTQYHYADGWRAEITPVYNPTLQYLGVKYFDAAKDSVRWTVINKTVQQLAAEKESVLQSIEQGMDIAAIKKLLIILTKDVLSSPTVTAETLTALSTIYPQYRVGKAYLLNDVFVYENNLYRVVQAHTSQADWIPATTPALYTKYTPPGQIAAWVQPTGAQDAYNIGDKVTFEGFTWESLINANVWSPTAYPQGWKKL